MLKLSTSPHMLSQLYLKKNNNINSNARDTAITLTTGFISVKTVFKFSQKRGINVEVLIRFEL